MQKMQMPGSCPTDTDTPHTSEEASARQKYELKTKGPDKRGKGNTSNVKCDPPQPVGASLDFSLGLFSPALTCPDALVSFHRLRTFTENVNHLMLADACE